jgi:orotate phosphoribosyltransferase
VGLIRAHGAVPAGVVIALDRMERGQGERSAVQEVREQYGMPVAAVVTLDDLIGYLETDPVWGGRLSAVSRYREQYGV